jgi:hypothetical protein
MNGYAALYVAMHANRPLSTGLCLPAKYSRWLPVLLCLAMLSARGDDLPAPVTLDLPIAANQALPAWLGKPESDPTAFASLNLPIQTPDPAASLLVTVYFQENDGGFMRVIWKGPQNAAVLSGNFYENIGMANQRSLLISPTLLAGGGSLAFQCGSDTLGIRRIKLEWLESKSGLVAPAVQDMMVTQASGQTQPSQVFNGQAEAVAPAAWDDQLISVPLDDQPVRIEEGVEFSVDLDNVPRVARIALKESGLPLGKRLSVWINDQLAGTITPAVPDLTDGGFLADSSTTATSYVGWRDGSFYVPSALLKVGINSLQFDPEDDASTGKTAASSTTAPAAGPPLALKDIVFQLDYQPPPEESGTPQPQLLLGPVEPMPPAAALAPSTGTNPP